MLQKYKFSSYNMYKYSKYLNVGNLTSAMNSLEICTQEISKTTSYILSLL